MEKRNGLRVQALSANGVAYTQMVERDGEWYLTGNTRYSDSRLEQDGVQVTIREGAIADYDLLASSAIYVRLGGIPDGGRSYNRRDGVYEAGVSAFRAAWDGDTLVVDGNAGVILFGTDRPLYEIAGRLLESDGSDGEPILADACIVREINRDNVRFAR